MTTPWYFNPILLQIGPVQIHWYGMMYALGFLAGYFYLHYSAQGKRIKLNSDQKDIFLAVVIAGILIGGRLGYVLFYNLPYYLGDPLKIFAVWEGGMSFHGGLIGVALALLWFIRKHKVHIFQLSDIVTAIAPVGLFFGRLGNFINGELYGRVATNFCLYFPSDPNNCRYPSQLFEAVFEGLTIFIVLQLIRRKIKTDGVLTAWFFLLYGSFRIVIEFFREPDPQIGFLPGGITEGQLLSFLMILGGILIMSIAKKIKK